MVAYTSFAPVFAVLAASLSAQAAPAPGFFDTVSGAIGSAVSGAVSTVGGAIGSATCNIEKAKIFQPLSAAATAAETITNNARSAGDFTLVGASEQLQKDISDAQGWVTSIAEAIFDGVSPTNGINALQGALVDANNILCNINVPDDNVMQAVQEGKQNVQDALHISEDARSCNNDSDSDN